MTDNQRQYGPRAATRRFSSRALVSLTLGLLVCTGAFGQTGTNPCGELANGFGPFDYRKYAGTAASKSDMNDPLYLVEIAHFRPEMVALVRGGQGVKSDVGPEFDYTLRAFPNHARALDAVVRLSEKQGTDQPKGMRYTVDCWFQRAIRFRPDDATVRMIYATYLGKKNRVADATKHLEITAANTKENPFTQYNIGLIYFDLKQFDRALAQAHIAYGLGMPRTELRDRLVSANQWREPVAAAPNPEPAASAPK